jgi:hypothetical protein
MKMWGIIMLILSMLVGCATSKQVYTSDGQQGHSIDCSGTGLNWGMCYEKAGDICGTKGYVVLEKNGESGVMATETQMGPYAGSLTERKMIIECKE